MGALKGSVLWFTAGYYQRDTVCVTPVPDSHRLLGWTIITAPMGSLGLREGRVAQSR